LTLTKKNMLSLQKLNMDNKNVENAFKK